jgi:hypothetical protein
MSTNIILDHLGDSILDELDDPILDETGTYYVAQNKAIGIGALGLQTEISEIAALVDVVGGGKWTVARTGDALQPSSISYTKDAFVLRADIIWGSVYPYQITYYVSEDGGLTWKVWGCKTIYLDEDGYPNGSHWT